jgi:GNAT superfamily N-acetyltransferase
VGTAMLNFILEYLRLNSIQRIILWGGVQADNEKAVQYYLKNHFPILGEFEYNGRNYDMMYKLD